MELGSLGPWGWGTSINPSEGWFKLGSQDHYIHVWAMNVRTRSWCCLNLIWTITAAATIYSCEELSQKRGPPAGPGRPLQDKMWKTCRVCQPKVKYLFEYCDKAHSLCWCSTGVSGFSLGLLRGLGLSKRINLSAIIKIHSRWPAVYQDNLKIINKINTNKIKGRGKSHIVVQPQWGEEQQQQQICALSGVL